MTTNSTNSTVSAPHCDHVIDRPLIQGILIAVDCLLMILSLAGNILVVAVVYRNKELRTNVNYFIVSMAISDLLIPFFYFPVHLNDIINGRQIWIGGGIGEFTCKFAPYAMEVSTTVSTLTMIAIAIDRFYCVLFPLRTALISNKVRCRVISTIWVVTAVLQGYYFYIRRLEYDSDIICATDWRPLISDGWKAAKIQHIVMFVFLLAMPFTILAVLYTAIIVTLYRRPTTALRTTSANAKQREVANRKTTIMLAIVAFVFLAAWMPFWVLIFQHFFFGRKVNCYLILAVAPSVSLYAAFNPLVYYTFSMVYRQGFNEILCCIRPRLPNQSSRSRTYATGISHPQREFVELKELNSKATFGLQPQPE